MCLTLTITTKCILLLLSVRYLQVEVNLEGNTWSPTGYNGGVDDAQ